MLYNDPLITTLWGDQLLAVARMLAANRDFFELSSAQRQEKVAELVTWLQPYVVSVSEGDFLADTQSLFLGETEMTGLLQALVDYYLKGFLLIIDTLPDDFGARSLADKAKSVAGLHFTPAEESVLSSYSAAQIETGAEDLFRKFAIPGGCVLVESPLPLDLATKKMIRDTYASDVVFFHVKADLLGGLRVLKNGRVQDYSWSQRIARISQKLNVL